MGVAGQAVCGRINIVVGEDVDCHVATLQRQVKESQGHKEVNLAVGHGQQRGGCGNSRSQGKGSGSRSEEGGGLHGSITGLLGCISGLTKRTGEIGRVRQQRSRAQWRGTTVLDGAGF